MLKTTKNRISLVFLLLLAQMISGCAGMKQRQSNSSVVDYLYSDAKDPVKIEPSIPVLSLPLRVGIAFVPGNSNTMTERDKAALIDQVAAHFKTLPYVKAIETIPSAYLRPRGGFANLDQIKTMYGVDVIALVSFDQVQFTDSNFLSFTYWSIIGAYIIPGEKNDTHTMLDTVVYDIASRKMLFRAPGTSHIKGHSTPINLSEQLRADSAEGLQLANKDMIGNLDLQLVAFKDKVKEQPADYQIVHRPGYSGGGAIDLATLLLIAAGVGAMRIRKNPARADR